MADVLKHGSLPVPNHLRSVGTRAAALKAYGVCRGGFDSNDQAITCEARASASNKLCATHSKAYQAGNVRMSLAGVKRLLALPENARAYGASARPKANRGDATPKSAGTAKAKSGGTTMKRELAAVKRMKAAQTSEERIAATEHKSTPPVCPMGSGAVARTPRGKAALDASVQA